MYLHLTKKLLITISQCVYYATETIKIKRGQPSNPEFTRNETQEFNVFKVMIFCMSPCTRTSGAEQKVIQYGN
jgi:hypothetical protein